MALSLVDGDFTLWESNAILQYAADKHQAFAYYPREPKLRADIHRWQLWESAHWYPSCYVYLVENLVKPFMKIETDAAAIEREAPNWHKLAGILEQRLSNQRWVCGKDLTLADIAVAAPMHLHPYQKLPLETYPSLRRWMTEDIEQLPCWKETDVATALGLKQS
jgi:glutathione S-transferase